MSTAAPATLAAIALGGALGSLARHGLGAGMRALAPALPLGTLLVNVAGSFAIGLLAATVARGAVAWPEWLRLGLATGVLGGFTTFSSFSLETLLLWREGASALAVLNVTANLLLGLAACAGGFQLAAAR